LIALVADGGYQGPEFQKALAKILPYLETEIVKRFDHAKGFVVLPRRWIPPPPTGAMNGHIPITLAAALFNDLIIICRA
jgi:hypothetical protein